VPPPHAESKAPKGDDDDDENEPGWTRDPSIDLSIRPREGFGILRGFLDFARARRGAPRPSSGRQARRPHGLPVFGLCVGGTHYLALPGAPLGVTAPQQYDFTQAETHVFLNRTAHDFRLGPDRGAGLKDAGWCGVPRAFCTYN